MRRRRTYALNKDKKRPLIRSKGKKIDRGRERERYIITQRVYTKRSTQCIITQEASHLAYYQVKSDDLQRYCVSKNKKMDSPIIISHFGITNIILVDSEVPPMNPLEEYCVHPLPSLVIVFTSFMLLFCPVYQEKYSTYHPCVIIIKYNSKKGFLITQTMNYK